MFEILGIGRVLNPTQHPVLAQLVERWTVNVIFCGYPQVAGSIPANRMNLIRSYGLMVMTADFESASLGSIPSRTFCFI